MWYQRNWGAVAFMLLIAYFAVPAPGASDALRDVRKRVTDASKELTRAKVALMNAQKKVRKQIEDLPQWKEATAAAREAGARYTGAAKAVRAAVAKKSEYQAAVAERGKKQKALEAIKATADPKPDELTQAAVAVLNADAVVSRIERAALAADPAASKAKADLDAANASLASLRNTFAQRAKDDPDCQAAQQRLQKAGANYDQAANELAQAKKQQASEDERKMDSEINDARRDLQQNTGRIR